MATMSKKKKFDDIKSTINTGLHYGNVKIIPKRRGELFRRLKTKEMVTLLQLYLDETEKETESISNLISSNQDEDQDENENKNDNVNNHNKVSLNLIGHQNDEEDYPQIPPLTDLSSSFLLLDIRNQEEFEKYHIKGAKHYDMSLLRRDRLGNDIYAFKNKPDKIIIICCDEQNVGIKFSNELSKKYIDNIFLLTTSIQRFCIKFPDLCVGHSFPEKDIHDNEPKARMHFVDWKPEKKNNKMHYSLLTRFSPDTPMSTISNATSVRTWKP